MRSFGHVKDKVEKYGDLLSTLWADDTAISGSRPLPSGMPLSHGHCLPASCVLLDTLRCDFGDLNLQLARGRVVRLVEEVLRPIIAHHVWINLQPEQHPVEEGYVIGVTEDQGGLPAVLFEPYVDLDQQGIVYAAHRTYPDTDSLVSEYPAAAPAVEMLAERFRALL